MKAFEILPAEVKEKVEELLSKLREFSPDLPEGATPLKHLELILIALDLDPSPLDLYVLAADNESGDEDYVTWDISKCIAYFMERKSNPVELLRAYGQFDCQEKGYISLDDLKRAATAAGENMSDIELKELLDAADDSGVGVVNQEDFFKFIEEVHLSLKEI